MDSRFRGNDEWVSRCNLDPAFAGRTQNGSPGRRPGPNFTPRLSPANGFRGDAQARRYNAAVIQPPRLMCCLLMLALCAALIACTQQPQRPDLGRLYRVGSALQDT